ncbi:hypothetical protein FO519_003715 [Halicephalobus sp. NKZ332]|nr:hypothetical protein FO519_003715 [Halicephalobus sp. NKZ332]
MVDLKVSTPLDDHHPLCDEIDVLAALLREKSSLITTAPACFPNIQKLVDLEIWRIRQKLFHHEFKFNLELPESVGPVSVITEKLYLPKKEHPDFNFVGRIIGPRGVTSKQIEYATGCKIMIRGKGSTRASPRRRSSRSSDKDREEDDLHVIIQCEDTADRAKVRIEKAKELINQIIDPDAKGDSDLKRRQLLELAILNGSYRERASSSRSNSGAPNSPVSNGRFRSRNSLSLSPPVGSPVMTSVWTNQRPMDEEIGWIWKELKMNSCRPRSLGTFPFCNNNNGFRAESNYGSSFRH